MLGRTTVVLALVVLPQARAIDQVLLKDGAAVVGRILVEKRDAVVVDLGYTVQSVPRNQIIKIQRGDRISKPVPEEVSAAAEPPAVTSGLFRRAEAVAAERTVKEWVDLLGEAVVQVKTPSGLGSGFLLNDQGYLITNFHVIENETQISVEVYHRKTGELARTTYRQVRIVAMNKYADLALLRIEDPAAPAFASVIFGSSESLAAGERVFAVGSPLGLERTVTEGIVSTSKRQVLGDLYLQTTAQINPGNSGGPLFNLHGAVVGVTNMKISAGEGIGFAIPIERVEYFLTHRDAYAYDNDNPASPYRYLEPPRRARAVAPPP